MVVGDLLMETRRALGPRCSSFRDVAVSAFSARESAGLVLDATVTLQGFGTLVGYLVAVGDLVSSSVKKGWGLGGEVVVRPAFFLPRFGGEWDMAISTRVFTLILLSLGVFFPLCLLRRLESLRALAAGTMVIYFVFLLVLAKEAAAGGGGGGGELNWMGNGWAPLSRVLPIIALSYSCVPLMIEVRKQLERKLASQQQVDSAWRFVSIASFVASGFFYVATGFLGYVAFSASTQANVLSNLEDLGWIATGVNALFAVSLVVSYPLIAFVVREPIRRTFYFLTGAVFSDDNAADVRNGELHDDYRKDDDAELNSNNNNSQRSLTTNETKQSMKKNTEASQTDLSDARSNTNSVENPTFLMFVLEALIVTSLTLAAAIALPGIDVVLELIGGTAAVFVSYIAPVGLFLIVKPERTYAKDFYKAVTIGLVGMLISVLTCWNLWVSLSKGTTNGVGGG